MKAQIFYAKNLFEGYRQHPDEPGSYQFVAEIEASFREEVFALMNRGSGKEHPVLNEKDLRSFSVGDIVCMGGVYHVCETIDWTMIDRGSYTEVLAAMVGAS